ncbi:multifunctional nuclease/2',3'-cyclic-nucleotide 2'-phosphodiesterase/5'-nucleotidase/3'-nucleotidase [Actinoplanes ianthinogenes]|uniref:Multifunctional nuclease/2',3'-cyclic-nucleotide 2'-phosphodiesterase/5'-nucleotidase/3'-nucleotidase n=1 Tax=Actinoplanes ianthinogenes TaxID=122358 RepID=A0ABM7LXW1_9ACTN|nr:multifunctional nuclease/2',3'-cyclic-nucleotide 2'-phosphodiesterase/5'-nucleotidase/3'-nucleotidase [Actinoplanes ianthinogenes]GGQ96224.1 multifunctional nuclease/2',3'-cyclic-nucleotide 2'-phosphodiesterase/5'-nucleotidase/3'-nucleotidase [Actinoplanes ianthinogenes]
MRPYIRSVSPPALRALGAAALATALGLGFSGPAFAAEAQIPFISEIHYDNVGADSGEAIEVQAPAGTDLSGWQIVLYNGTGGATYGTAATLSGAVPAAGVVVQTYPTDGLQNGAPDGVALVKPDGTVAEFLSYEGSFTATNGPASGRTSTDIGVSETSSTPVGASLQKIDGVWQVAATSSFGTVNGGGTTDPEPPATGCTTTVTNTIAEVQGPGAASPLAGSKVTIEGVVTAVHTTGGFNGFYLQTEGTGGTHAGTASDAVFVYGVAANLPAVAIGDKARVTGTVTEFNGLTEVTLGAKTDTQVCATGVTVPAAVPLSLPAGDDAREALEGMLVAPTGKYTVSDTYPVNNYGELVLAAGDSVAKVPTDVAKPGSDEAKALKAANRAGRILLDDGRTTNLSTANVAPPYITKDAPVRTGDTVASFGPVVLDYAYGDWLLEPTTPVDATTPAANRTTFTATNPRTAAPAAVGGDVKVASFNVLNYFVHFGGDARGATDAAALAKQQAKIVSAISALDADVVALMEIENSVRFEANDPQLALKTLVGALNERDGAGTWDYVRTPAELPGPAEQDLITTAIIFKPAKVTPKGASRSLSDETVWSNAREPIAQTFTAGSIDFTVVANHLKSKSASVTPTGDNVDTGDGQGPYNGDRKRQAASLVEFVKGVEKDSGTDKVILLGDFNSYTQEDPMQVLYQAGYTDVHTTKAPGKSSYVFGGESGSLDHALTTPSLTDRVTGVDIWNINSVESYAYQYTGYAPFYSPTPYRASDHDPVVIGLDTSAPKPFDLQLLNINDFHGRLEAPTAGTGGAAQLVGLVDKLRSENPNTVWSSAGDNIGASTFISAIDGDNPTIDALNAGGLAVSAVGNHEFDKGIADLTGRVQNRAKFPFLGANVYQDGKRALPAYSVLTVNGVKVGYIGVVTGETKSLVSPDGIKGVEFHDPVAEANTVAAQLSDGDAANGEADVIVLLAHEGAATANINSAEALQNDPVFGNFTKVSADIDAIFSGHTHQPYAFEIPVPGTDKTRPVLQAEDYGVKLGRAVLTYDPATKSVVKSTAELIDVKGYAENSTVAGIVATAKATATELGKQKLGSITADIKRAYSATGSEDRGSESVMGNFIADVQLDQTKDAGRGGAQIAFMNPGGLRNDLAFGTDGTVTYAQAFAVQPFANDVVTKTLSGADIKNVLEEQWQPATASRPVLHLGSSKGFTYSYDVNQPKGSRIIASSMKLNGVTIDPNASYRVTMNSFLASGGDNFTTLGKNPATKTTTGDNDLTMLVNYFAKYSPITADTTPRSTPGVFDTTAPAGTYAVNAAAIWPGQTVTLTQSALSDDVTAAGKIKQVVNWGDGSAAETLEAGATTATHKYAAAGSYPITVTLTDEAGNAATVSGGTVAAAAQTGKYTLDKCLVWSGETVTVRPTGVTGADSFQVNWGDGTVGGLTHVYTKGGSFTVTATPVNAAGAGTAVKVGPVLVVKDVLAPIVGLSLPRDADKAASWTQLNGTVVDLGAGVGTVSVKLIEERSGKWYYYAAGTWTVASSEKDATAKAAAVDALLDPFFGWHATVSGVDKGTLKVSYWATDKAGNQSYVATHTQRITK